MDNLKCKSCNNTTYFYWDVDRSNVCGCCHEAAYDDTIIPIMKGCTCGLSKIKDPISEHSTWCSSTEVDKDSINMNKDSKLSIKSVAASWTAGPDVVSTTKDLSVVIHKLSVGELFKHSVIGEKYRVLGIRLISIDAECLYNGIIGHYEQNFLDNCELID